MLLVVPKSKRVAPQEAASQGRGARCDGALLKEGAAIRTPSQGISFCLHLFSFLPVEFRNGSSKFARSASTSNKRLDS
jgi:hypothetical protein